MTWQKNYFPSENQPWSRQVEKEVDNLKSNFRSAEVNNTTRDDQLASSFKQLSLTTAQAIEANNNALAAIQDVVDLGSPGGPSINASNINAGTIDASVITVSNLNASNITSGSLSADRITSGTLDASDVNVTNINASNINTGAINASLITTGILDASDISVINLSASSINTGTLSADRISGGTIDGSSISGVDISGVTITGSTFATSGTRRVELTGTNANFYDSSGTLTGRVTAGEDGRAATLYFGTNVSGVFAYNGGMDLEANGVVQVTGGNGFSSTSISNSGAYTGNGFPTIANNTVSGTTFPANVFIATGGNMARKTDASERRLKENIQDFEFDTQAFINVKPVTFNYKREAVSSDEQAQAVNVGFVLDDFEAAGLSDFLVYQAEGDDFKQLRYDLLSIYLHKVVQEQDKTIRALEARIEALESQV